MKNPVALYVGESPGAVRNKGAIPPCDPPLQFGGGTSS